MISKEEVKRVANLARLDLTEKEVEKFQKELSSILDYVEKLKEADVSGIRPASYAIAGKNVMRQDLAAAAPEGQTQKLLELFPATKERFLKVKPVLKNGIEESDN